MKTALDLTITCRYSRKLPAAQEEEARHLLESVAQQLAGGGMLTGESPNLELDFWEVKVRRTPRREK